jgi:hypothetical protein
MCLAAGSAFLDCCPKASTDDGVCTMLWCVHLTDLSVNEGCTCDMIEYACGQVRPLGLGMGLAETCIAVRECCMDDGSTAIDEYDACIM